MPCRLEGAELLPADLRDLPDDVRLEHVEVCIHFDERKPRIEVAEADAADRHPGAVRHEDALAERVLAQPGSDMRPAAGADLRRRQPRQRGHVLRDGRAKCRARADFSRQIGRLGVREPGDLPGRQLEHEIRSAFGGMRRAQGYPGTGAAGKLSHRRSYDNDPWAPADVIPAKAGRHPREGGASSPRRRGVIPAKAGIRARSAR